MLKRRRRRLAQVWTIGHSSHTPERFLELLRLHRIDVLVDTRSAPYSRFAPHFDRPALRDLINGGGIKYLYLGDALGGRPRDSLVDPRRALVWAADSEC